MGSQNIEFLATDGVKLRGSFFSAGTSRPCVIMSNGFSGLKEQFLPDFAQRFQEAGYTVLIYDNRNWGESDGMPRNETDPLAQSRDYFAAFDYVSSLPSVDASKIVYWGSSMAGGNVISAASVDKRIRGVISQIPFVSGEFLAATLGPKTNLIFTDRNTASNGGASKMIPVTPESREAAESGTSQAILADPSVYVYLDELDRRGIKYESMCTTQSLLYLQQHEPQSLIHRVAPTPMLMIVAERDDSCITHLQLRTFHNALEPKRLHILRGATHFSPYFGPQFEENIKVQLDFLKEVMA